MQSVCHGYRCILLYINLILCSGFPETYAKLERGWGQSAMGICCSFVEIYAHLEERM